MYDVRRDESIRQSTDRTSVTSSKKANLPPSQIPSAGAREKAVSTPKRWGQIRPYFGINVRGKTVPSIVIDWEKDLNEVRHDFMRHWVARRVRLRPLGDRRSVGKSVMLRSGSVNPRGPCRRQLLLRP